MAAEAATIKDRVRENTAEDSNMRIDQKAVNRIYKYRTLTKDEITEKLNKLYKEWDVERALEVNASSLAITGLLLGTFGSKRWFVLPVVAVSFLLQHGIQGWCPPLTVLRRLGYRTRQEIDEEIYALKALRGDFDSISATSDPIEILAGYRK
jgi:uncharacterized protein YdcH (DUF465 family)